MSNRYLVMVLTEPTEGNEDAFNDYYEHTHLDEVLATTHFSSAQRYRLVNQAGNACPLPYLALYETEAEDSAAVLKDLNETRGQRLQSETLNRRTAGVWVFETIGTRHQA